MIPTPIRRTRESDQGRFAQLDFSGLLAGAITITAFSAPFWAVHAAFDTPFFWWTGLPTRVPASADHIPIPPWIVPMLAGVLAGRVLPAQAGPAPRWLTWPGRHTLAFCLLRRAVLIGALLAAQPDAVCATYAGCATSRLEPLLPAAHAKRMTSAQREEWTRVLGAAGPRRCVDPAVSLLLIEDLSLATRAPRR